MVPLDGSELAECVLPHLEAVAGGCNVGTVTLVRVVKPLHLYGGAESGLPIEERQRLEKDSMDVARNYLDQVAKRLRDHGILAQTEVLFGHVIDKLIEYANNSGVDLIVIATHGRSGIGRLVWGNDADRILRSSSVPVMMVRAPVCKPVI